MTIPTDDLVAGIAEHSAGLAATSREALDAPVEHCPGWTVADLVWHLTEVHWFWRTIAAERLAAPPEDARRPRRGAREHLLDDFEAGARRLVEVLAGAPPAEPVWTWAPAQRDIAFIIRHQVQEAAVHHWDAVHAAGGALTIAPVLAADAVAEFLTFSVSSDADPAEPAPPALSGTFALRADDIGASWTLTDGAGPGTVRMASGADGAVPTVTGTASDLLLWLYRRVDLDTSPLPAGLLDRFRALSFTD